MCILGLLDKQNPPITSEPIKPTDYFEIEVKKFMDNPLVVKLPPEIIMHEYALVTFEDSTIFDKQFNDLVTPIMKIVESNDLYNNRFYRLKHKLVSLLYHRGNYKNSEDFHIELFKNSGEVRRSDAYFQYKKPNLVYEIESFLFQVKSCLDIIGSLIGMIFGWKDIKRYEKKGDIFIKMAKSNCPKNLTIYAKHLIEFVTKHKSWTENLIRMRDQITHFSDLKGLCCFITHFTVQDTKAKIFYPIMPDGKRVLDYLNQTWTNLLAFFNDFVLLFKRVTTGT